MGMTHLTCFSTLVRCSFITCNKEAVWDGRLEGHDVPDSPEKPRGRLDRHSRFALHAAEMTLACARVCHWGTTKLLVAVAVQQSYQVAGGWSGTRGAAGRRQ